MFRFHSFSPSHFLILFAFLIIFLIYRCDGITSVPLLVPLTGWLPFPLPSQVNKHCTALTIFFSLPFSSHFSMNVNAHSPFHGLSVVDFSLWFVSFRFVTFSFSISISISLAANNDCDRNRRDPFNCNGTVKTTFSYCATSWRCTTLAYYE